jgi:hypothetical protein
MLHLILTQQVRRIFLNMVRSVTKHCNIERNIKKILIHVTVHRNRFCFK